MQIKFIFFIKFHLVFKLTRLNWLSLGSTYVKALSCKAILGHVVKFENLRSVHGANKRV